jgi:hypothetical protein
VCVIGFFCSAHQWLSLWFFKASRGLRQGCPLSPFLFLLIVESLSRLLNFVRHEGSIKGILVVEVTKITHFLFVDGVLLFGDGSVREWRTYKHILETFCLATGMEISSNKSLILCNELSPEVEAQICHMFSFVLNL